MHERKADIATDDAKEHGKWRTEYTGQLTTDRSGHQSNECHKEPHGGIDPYGEVWRAPKLPGRLDDRFDGSCR